MEDLQNEYARKFHTIRPTHQRLTLTDEQYQYAAKNILNLPPADGFTKCFCGASLKNKPDHLHYCPQTRKKEINQRYDMIVKALARLGDEIGTTCIESRVSKDTLERTDTTIYALDGTFSFDVVVTHTNCPSYKKRNMSVSALKEAKNNMKNTKYLNKESKDGRIFSSFPISSYGAMFPSTIAILRKLASIAESTGMWSQNAFFQYAIYPTLIC